MLKHRGSTELADAWRATPADEAGWEAGARARLGDLGLFHHPRVARLGISQDPHAEKLHFLEWAPADGRAALPLVLVETWRKFGPLKLPVLTFPTHTLYVYSALVPGLLPALLDRDLGVAPARFRFFPRLPMDHVGLGGEVSADANCELTQEDVAPRVLLRERWGGDWSAYWNARDPVVLRAARRERQLEREGPLEFHAATRMDAPAREALERAMSCHTSRWGRQVHDESDLGRSGNRERLFELAAHFETGGTLRLHWMVWKGEVAAMVLGARYGATWFFYWAAMNPAVSRYSPGNVLYMRMLREAFAEGLEVADFMLGGAAYKDRWKDAAPGVTTVLKSGSNVPSALLYQAVRLARRLKGSASRDVGAEARFAGN